MARLYFDQLQSSGTRYYFALDSSPGIIVPGVATLTLNGLSVSINDQAEAFRTPATASLTLSGLALQSPGFITPAQAALGYEGRIAGLVTGLTISPALPTPDYSTPPDNPPTVLTIMTVSPAQAALGFATLEQNVTQGGNIGFVSPASGTITLAGLQPLFTFYVGDPAALSLVGLSPTIVSTMLETITPEVGAVTLYGYEVVLDLPFTWIDEDPVSGTVWIDEPPA